MQNNVNIHLKTKVQIIFLLFQLFAFQLWGQITDTVSTALDSIPGGIDSVFTVQDSLIIGLDSLPLFRTDSTALQSDLSKITFSKDSLDAPVDYNASDSMIYDIADQKIHLFGNASVSYTTITLTASKIVLDWNTNIVVAEGLPDSTGKMAGFPVFQDGEQQFTAKRMRYNFQTKKGIVYDVTTQQNDIFVHGERSKFVTGEQEPGDTTKPDDIVFSRNALFTTCTHPEPHFGIRSRKQKVIPNKLVIVGPSNLEIMNVPTPIWLPFGFFPISKTRSTGLLFPRDYEYSEQWGFGLRDIGWFFPLGDHFNLSVTGNIYFKGTWGIGAYSQYRKRYKYNGNLNLAFDQRRNEDSEGQIVKNNSFSIRWSHNQDRSAHPSNTFRGSVNIQTNGFQSRVYNDANSVLQNQLSSNIAFSKNWQDKPINLNASFTHNQNTATNNVTINFPVVKFQTQTLYPFKKKKRSGKEQWYEKVTLRYIGEAKNRFVTTDTTLFSRQTLEDAQFGVKHDITSGTSFKLFKYFNLNPNITYKEVWYLNSLQKEFDPTPVVDTTFIENPDDSTDIQEVYDTVSYGTVNEFEEFGFRSYRTYNASISLNTQIFGTVQFKKGWLRGIRHTVKPSVSFNYSPNYLNPDLGYYDRVQDDLRFPDEEDFQLYSPFEDGIFGRPPQSGKRMSLSYSINNIFEAKYFSRKDSIDKKFKLFDNIRIGGNYNFAADSLKWSKVTMAGTTRLFKGATTVSVGASFDPYIEEENEKGNLVRVNKTAWKTQGRLLRFEDARASFNTRMTVGKIRAIFQGKEEEVVEDLEEERRKQRERAVEEQDFLALLENFSINHTFALRWEINDQNRDTLIISTNSLNVRGNIQLTDKWGINIGNFGYDFVRKGLSYPSLGFSRDLHCWELGMNWQPTRGTYSFYIRVKPGSLDFINIPYNRNNADAFNAFR
jgi:lipopolysaccharide assembly outer membrane protein LptD (OstA)